MGSTNQNASPQFLSEQGGVDSTTWGEKLEGKSFQDVWDILQVILGDEKDFETITWRKSQALKLHNTRNWFPSNPEQANHLKWHAAQQSK